MISFLAFIYTILITACLMLALNNSFTWKSERPPTEEEQKVSIVLIAIFFLLSYVCLRIALEVILL